MKRAVLPAGFRFCCCTVFPMTRSFDAVVEIVNAAGFRTIVPYLRGYGGTTFLSADTPRSGEQAALGQDLKELLDALGIQKAVLAGYDWGGRAACVVSALWPERVAGLVSCAGYNIQDIPNSSSPPIRSRRRGTGISIIFTPNAAATASPKSAARYPGCSGKCGRRPGRSMTRRSTGPPPPSTTRILSMSSFIPTGTGPATPPAIRATRPLKRGWPRSRNQCSHHRSAWRGRWRDAGRGVGRPRQIFHRAVSAPRAGECRPQSAAGSAAGFCRRDPAALQGRAGVSSLVTLSADAADAARTCRAR